MIGFTCDGMSLIWMVAFKVCSEAVLSVPIFVDRSPQPVNSTSIHLMNQSINTSLKTCASECQPVGDFLLHSEGVFCILKLSILFSETFACVLICTCYNTYSFEVHASK